MAVLTSSILIEYDNLINDISQIDMASQKQTEQMVHKFALKRTGLYICQFIVSM